MHDPEYNAMKKPPDQSSTIADRVERVFQSIHLNCFQEHMNGFQINVLVCADEAEIDHRPLAS